METVTKRCSRCKAEKPLSAFNKDKVNKDGLGNWCKGCWKAYYAEISTPEYKRKNCEKAKAYYQENKASVIPKAAKRVKEARAKLKAKDPQALKEKRHQEYLNGKDKQLEKTRQRKYKEYRPGLFDELYTQQEGRCAICGAHQSELRTALCIDHNHDTNKIRGLLCNRCNIGIMNFKEDAENCLKAYQYLRQRS